MDDTTTTQQQHQQPKNGDHHLGLDGDNDDSNNMKETAEAINGNNINDNNDDNDDQNIHTTNTTTAAANNNNNNNTEYNNNDNIENDNDNENGNDASSILSSSSSHSSSSSSTLLSSSEEEDDDDDDDDDEKEITTTTSRTVTTTTSSSSSSLTLTQRLALNLERNKKFLGKLSKKYDSQIKTRIPSKNDEENNDESLFSDDDDDMEDIEDDDRDGSSGSRGGMVMLGTHRLFQSLSILGRRQGVVVGNKNSNNNYVEGIRNLERIYPYRNIQIGQLSAVLSGTISLTSSIISNDNNTNQVYVPAPIFCTGPKGTGKTSIVCDVIETLLLVQQQQQQQQNCVQNNVVQIQPAYINCSTVEPSTIERLVYTIYQQLRPSSSSSSPSSSKSKSKTTTTSPNQKIGKRKRKKMMKKFQSGLLNQQQSDEQQPKILPSRKAKRAATRRTYANDATTNFNNEIKKRRRQMKKNKLYNENGDHDDDIDQIIGGENNVETSHKAVMSLGRSLQRYYGEGSSNNNVGILVLDKGEELLSLSSIGKKKSASSSTAAAAATNFLSELLLLPKIMKLNITVIVITNYSTLDMTRLNNSVAPSKSLATISNGLHPMIIQFPAYTRNRVFREILTTEQNQRLVMGDSMTTPDGDDDNGESAAAAATATTMMRPSLKKKLVGSFWNTVIQFASDSTRDIHDFLRLGRALWPQFVGPLHPAALRTTMEIVTKRWPDIPALTKKNLQNEVVYTKVEDELVRVLGMKFHPQIAALASGDDNITLLILDENGIVPSGGTTTAALVHNTNNLCASLPQPYLRSCLLLAAFICQNNKADQDRKLFSVHGNGRRRKKSANKDIYGGNDEDLAFGSITTSSSSTGQHQVEQLKSLRLRPVPFERVLSIFVTLVRLNPLSQNIDADDDDLEVNMDDLGSTRLYTDLSHLIDLGYLHPAKGNHIHSSPARFVCSLTTDEAIEISTRIGIPIERYLI